MVNRANFLAVGGFWRVGSEAVAYYRKHKKAPRLHLALLVYMAYFFYDILGITF